MTTTPESLEADTTHASGVFVIAWVLAATVVVAIPLQTRTLIVLVEHSPHLAGTQLQFSFIGFYELASIAIVVPAAALWRIERQSWTIASVGVITLALATAAWWAFDPTWEAAMRCLRLAGAAGLVVIVSTMSATAYRRWIVWPFALSAAVQSLVAIGQTLVWDSGRAGRDDLVSVDWTPGIGSFNHEYLLAAYLVLSIAVVVPEVGRGRKSGAVLVACSLIAGAGVATTFGRAAAAALALVVTILAVASIRRSDRRALASSLAPAAGFAVVAVIARSAWSLRASVGSSVRADQVSRAFEIISGHPWFGVGPGGYGPVLATWSSVPDTFVVHSVPLLVTAEYGIAVGVAFAAWVVAVGIGAARSSAGALAAFSAAVPFLVLDNLHLVYGAGVALFGVWLAVTARTASATAVRPSADTT